MLEQKHGERAKMKQDLVDANNRIADLIKEGDERQVALERVKEQEMTYVFHVAHNGPKMH